MGVRTKTESTGSSSLARARLEWPQRAARRRHPTFGTRQVWSCACYRIERFPRMSGRYIVSLLRSDGSVALLGDYPSLRRAQRVCGRHFREHQLLFPEASR